MRRKQLSESEIATALLNPRERGIWYLKGETGIVTLENETLIQALIEGVEKLGYKVSNSGVLETWH